MTPERRPPFETLKTVPFIDIAHRQKDAVGILTKKTKQRAQGILLSAMFRGVDPSIISAEYIQNAYATATQIAEEIAPGGRQIHPEGVDILYTQGANTCQEIFDGVSQIMAKNIFTVTKQVENGENSGSPRGLFVGTKDNLGFMFDVLDLVNLGQDVTIPGMRVIAESLHTHGVPAFYIGFGIYDMQNPLVAMTNNNHVTAQRRGELRLDIAGAEELKQAYINAAPRFDPRRVGYFSNGEHSARIARMNSMPR